jgi:two-component system chemotaxis response regulator CheY
MEFRKKKILLADDSHSFLMYMGIILKRMGFAVIFAETGVDVLKYFKLVEPDVVMFDVALEKMDGFTLLKQIKEDKEISHIPVVIVSADSTKETIQTCRDLGCAWYIKKPVKVDKIHEALEECLFSHQRMKRKHMRAPFYEKVEVKYNGTPHELYAESLSEGGIYIRKRDPFPVGSAVELTLPIKGDGPLRLNGIVVYVKGLFGDFFKIPPGMAVEFREVKDHEGKKLRRYVEHLIAHDIFESQEETVIEPYESNS